MPSPYTYFAVAQANIGYAPTPPVKRLETIVIG